MEEPEEIKKGIVERLREEGILNRNTGTHSIKSLKEVISNEANPILLEIRDALLSLVSSTIDQTDVLKEQKENQEEKAKDDKRNEKLRPKDENSGLIKAIRESYKSVSNLIDNVGKSFKDSVGKLKDFGSNAGGFLKKALAVAAIGFILKDIVDEWTGGAVTRFIESLTGENGIIKQIGATTLALGALGLILAPKATLTLGFLALQGIVKTGGLLLEGLGAMGRLMGPEGRLRRGLVDLTGALGSGGRRGSGGRGLLGSIGKLASSFGGMLGKLAGKAGLVALIGALAAGFTGLLSLIPGRAPRVPTPKIAEGVDPSIQEAMRRQEEARLKATAPDAARTAPPSVDSSSPSQPTAPAADASPRPATPAADASPRPAAIVDTPSAPSAGASGAGAALLPSTPDAPVDAASAANAVSPGKKAAIVAEAIGKLGLKTLPIVGEVLGAGLTAFRVYMGDTQGAMLEGTATFAPSLTGVPLDIALVAHDVVNDIYYETYGVYPFNDTKENRSARLPVIQEEAMNLVQEALGKNDPNINDQEDSNYQAALAISGIPMEEIPTAVPSQEAPVSVEVTESRPSRRDGRKSNQAEISESSTLSTPAATDIATQDAPAVPEVTIVYDETPDATLPTATIASPATSEASPEAIVVPATPEAATEASLVSVATPEATPEAMAVPSATPEASSEAIVVPATPEAMAVPSATPEASSEAIVVPATPEAMAVPSATPEASSVPDVTSNVTVSSPSPTAISDTPDATLIPDVSPSATPAATIVPDIPERVTAAEIVRAVRDVENNLYNETYGVYPSRDTEENRSARLPAIRKEAVSMVMKTLRLNQVKTEDATMMAPAPARVLSDAELYMMNDPNSPNYESTSTMSMSGTEEAQKRYTSKPMAESSTNQIRTESATRYNRGATSSGDMGDGLRGGNVVAPTNIRGGNTNKSVTNNYYTSTSTSRSIDPSLPVPLILSSYS